jgi:AraC-like DNA-binding protein
MAGSGEATGASEPATARDSPAASRGVASIAEFDTDSYLEHERMAAWRDVFGRSLLHLDFTPRKSERFYARARILRFGQIGVLKAATSSVDQSNAGLIGNDGVSFVWTLSGSTSSQLGRSAELGSSDGVLMSHSDVGSLSFREESRYVALALPKAALAARVPDIGALFGRPNPAANPAQRILRRYLELVEGDLAAADPELQAAFSDHVCDLLALALGATRDAGARARMRGLPAGRLHAIKDAIRRGCTRPDFSIHTVAAQHGISPRYVQRIFEESGITFTKYLTAERLAVAYRALCRSTADNRPISAIACD